MTNTIIVFDRGRLFHHYRFPEVDGCPIEESRAHIFVRCNLHFSRMNFSGGACSLTMLSSHHWPGMTTAFLVLLLTKEGKEACKDCFAFQDGEDAPEPDYKWDAAPSLNIHKVYKPPIIREEDQNATVIGDDNGEDGTNVEVDDDALSDEEWM